MNLLLQYTYPTDAPIEISNILARGKTSGKLISSQDIEILSGGTFTTDGQVITARAVIEDEVTTTEDWEVNVTASSYGEKILCRAVLIVEKRKLLSP